MRRRAVREKRKSGKSHRLNQAAKRGVAVIVDSRDFPLFAPVSAPRLRAKFPPPCVLDREQHILW